MKKQKHRVVSEQVAKHLHPEIQQLIWKALDDCSMKLSTMDDEHEFELSVLNQKQVIIHRQEIPYYEEKLVRKLTDTIPTIASVLILDNGDDGQRMVFPTERPMGRWLL